MLTEKELYFLVKNEGIRITSEKFCVATKHPRICKGHLGEISLVGKEIRFTNELKRTSIQLGGTVEKVPPYMDVFKNLAK